MQESLLQFIWQYSLYRSDALRTTAGDAVTVIHPGTLNLDAGPDFSNARIRVGSMLLAGNVELHLRTTDWARHSHDESPAYSRIILHVVLLHDQQELPAGAPLVEIGPHIPREVIDRYTGLLQAPARIPCAGNIADVAALVKTSWLNRVLVGRWERRLTEWQHELDASAGDWRVLYYRRLAAAFGLRVNTEPFYQTALALPLSVLQRHHASVHNLEALLFGAAGMLQDRYTGDYPAGLLRTWTFFRHKYGIVPVAGHAWKYMRMRPAAFPTLRIAQFAALFARPSGDLFSILQEGSLVAVKAVLRQPASRYWNTHYTFDGQEGRATPKFPGEHAIHSAIINAIAPLRFLQGYTMGNTPMQEAALELMSGLPAEENVVVREWAAVGWSPRNAAESQALLELFSAYCAPRRCLDCAVGLSIIRSRPVK